MIGAVVSGVSCAGGTRRAPSSDTGFSGVEFAARLAAERVGDVDGDDAAALVTRLGEVLLGHDRRRCPRRTPAARISPPSGRSELWMKSVGGCATPFGAARDAATGDEHRVPRVRPAPLVGARIAPHALRRVAEQAAAARRPGDALGVDVDVMGVVGGRRRCGRGRSAARKTFGLAGLRRSVTQIGRPSPRPPGVNGPRRRDRRDERGRRSRRTGSRRCRRGVTGRQLDEAPTCSRFRRVRVGDDVEARRGTSGCGSSPPACRCRGSRLVDVVVTRIERADDQLALRSMSMSSSCQ